ncbi:MAG: HEAT repeat domain-containing protein [Carboxylicivirga sp.]|jgi:putative intracellular protease/amidase|nr:HEAT repeat domain-containing protein [Carboxylicivirga sp.]
MKLFLTVTLFASLALSACTQKNKPTTMDIEFIRVGIFDTNGDSPGCITDAYEALRIDSMIKPEVIGAATIMSDEVFNYDLLLFPGGSGRAQTIKLGQQGMKRVQDLVIEHGMGTLGICAGSYVLSQTEGYPSLDLSGFEAIDIENDHRGHGLVKFRLTEDGKHFFPELAGKDMWFSKYYEGPVLAEPAKALFKGKSLSTMISDVHTIEGTPANMTVNRPFITASEAGKGKAVTFVGHPENTQGMRWMIPRMVRWAVNKEMITYSDQVVRPDIYQHEILYTTEQLAKQTKYFEMLWGSAEEKIEAINSLVEQSSWSAKKQVIGLIRDESPEVRLTAAKAIVEMERTDALSDLKMAVAVEKDEAVKKELERLFQALNKIVAN